MTKLSKLKEGKSVEQNQDYVGGGYTVLESGIYEGVLKHAYLQDTDKGATMIDLGFEVDGKTISVSECVMSGDKKGNKTYYVNKDGKQVNLPGFQLAQDICLILTDEVLSKQNTKEKVVKVWNKDKGAQVPTPVDMFVDLIGEEFLLAIKKEIHDKRVETANGYEPTGETREVNVFAKAMDLKSRKTVAEAKADDESTFYDNWLAAWEGKTTDRSTMKKETSSTSSEDGSKSSGSMFNKKKKKKKKED